jgi:DNA replication and repair protein RecF
MFLNHLSIFNFKNHIELDVLLDQKIICIIGNNGIGKTNLLDAIYYLSFCKSYFNSVDSQIIHHNADFFVIEGTYQVRDAREVIYCGLKRGQKKIVKRNNKIHPRLSDHIGLLPLVIISPNDSSLLTEGSIERRKLIDMIISQFDPVYLDHIIKYNHALEQRNKLLKDFARSNSFDAELLFIWDEQLQHFGTMVYEKRKTAINQIIPLFQQYYEFVSEGKEIVKLEYESQLHHHNLRDLLLRFSEKDRFLQHTTVGIHKDDLALKLDDYLIKNVGSQGQQKTFLIALKLAQFDFMKEKCGFQPLLLLDDIFDKLDAKRVQQIIKLVATNNFGQIFITDTNPDRIHSILNEIAIPYMEISLPIDSQNSDAIQE